VSYYGTDERTRRTRTLERYQELKTERSSSMDDHVRDIAQLILPRSAQFEWTDKNQARESDYNLILDNTGTMAHNTLSSGLMAGSTSPARPWFALRTPDADLMEFAPVKDWLFRVTQKMLAIFAKSNTYGAFRSMYGQLGIAGTAASVIVDNWDNVLHHYPQAWGRYVLGLNHLGQVDTIHREMNKTVWQLVQEFGIENCSTTVKNLYDRGTYYAPVQVLHTIEPRRDRDYTKIDNKNMAWRSCYLEMGCTEPIYLRESGFQEFPAICPRWGVEADDTYASIWPGAIALGDVRQLQHQQMRKGQGIDYQVNPPLQVPNALKNNPVDALPGGITYYDANSATAGVRSLYEVKLDLGMLREDIMDVRQRIDRAFYKDLFLMLANDDRSGVTAREVAERHEEKLLMLGPVLESLHNEMLQPMIELTFAKMLRAGLFSERGGLKPPAELEGHDLDVEFVGTLAQAQRAVGTSSIDKLVGTIGSLASIKPEALDKLDGDQVVDRYAELLGVDPSLIVADDQVAMIRSQRAQQQQMAAAAAMAPAAKDYATAAKAASEADPAAGALAAFTGYQ
jgi:hypothetical protein